MHVHDIVKTSMASLKRNRLRTGLSLLGIVIGVFSVTIIISLGVAVKSAIIGYFNDFAGENMIAVNPAAPGASRQNSMQALMMGASPESLTYDDLEAMENPKNLPSSLVVAGAVTGMEQATYGDKDFRSLLTGVSASYLEIVPVIKVGSGRFFSKAEEKSMSPVVVIGSKVAAELFGSQDPLGQKIKIKGIPLQVIGVLKPAGSAFGLDMDQISILPLRLMQKRLLGTDRIMEIDARAIDQAHIDQLVGEIERLLRHEHSITDPTKDDFVVTTMEQVTGRLNTITDVITWFLAFLAAISLLVGGIGIMNIMLVSVTERVREVGLRKALGAKNDDIMIQFLAESVALTSAGGLIGGGIGFVLTLAVVAVMRWKGLNVPYTVSVEAFIGAALVAAATGIVFGLKPARKAARLDPITSLRFE